MLLAYTANGSSDSKEFMTVFHLSLVQPFGGGAATKYNLLFKKSLSKVVDNKRC